MRSKYFFYTALREHRGQNSILNCQTDSLFFEEPFKFDRVLGASQSPARSLLTIKIQNSTDAIVFDQLTSSNIMPQLGYRPALPSKSQFNIIGV